MKDMQASITVGKVNDSKVKISLSNVLITYYHPKYWNSKYLNRKRRINSFIVQNITMFAT